MKNGILMAMLIAAPISAYSGTGGASHRLLWSNAKGLVAATDCRASTTDSVPLQVTEAFGQNRQLDRPKSSPTSLPITLDNFAKSDLADFVMEVKDVSPAATASGARLGLPLQGSFWQASMENDRYVTLICGAEKKSYILFDVFVPSREERAAEIGVSQDEMGFLQKFEIHTPHEAEAAINSITKTPTSFARSRSTSAGARSASNETATAKPNESSLTRLVIPHGMLAPDQDIQDTGSAHVKAAHTEEPAEASLAAASDFNQQKTAPTDSESDQGTSGNDDFDPVVCSGAPDIPVYDLGLKKFLFYAKPLEDVRLMQSFGTDSVARTIDGIERQLIRAQFPERPEGQNAGWIEEDVVKQKSACGLAAAKVARVQGKMLKTKGSGSFSFPMAARPKRSYREAPRKFRSGRARGRLHAACDLYRPVGERVGLIEAGRVIRGPYAFYQGVYAIEVQHSNGWIARYGEVLGRRAPGVKVGAHLLQGQTIGYVGWISSHKAQPMLHFELYSGRGTGPLTQRWSRGFQRRGDLIDPTQDLMKWETEKFGTHW